MVLVGCTVDVLYLKDRGEKVLFGLRDDVKEQPSNRLSLKQPEMSRVSLKRTGDVTGYWKGNIMTF